MKLNLTKIAEVLEREWSLSSNNANAISLHIGDVYEDWKRIIPLLESSDTADSELLGDEIQSMLLHAPNHLMAAAHLMGIPLKDVWELGISIDE